MRKNLNQCSSEVSERAVRLVLEPPASLSATAAWFAIPTGAMRQHPIRQRPGRDDQRVKGRCKAELIYWRGPWKAAESVDSLEWASWINHLQLLEPVGYLPPSAAEANYYRQLANRTTTTAPQKPTGLHDFQDGSNGPDNLWVRSAQRNMPLYNAEISAGSLLVLESKRLAALLLTAPDAATWHQAIELDNILQKSTPASARRQATLIRKRLSTLDTQGITLIVEREQEVVVQLLLVAAIKCG